jgi:chemotaxis protein CheD
MKHLIAEHRANAFLKPGEVIVSTEPVLVSTILGSCVAVTMYSPEKNIGAICHAMLPSNPGTSENLTYVDSAIRYLYRAMVGRGGLKDVVIKIFGGAQVLAAANYCGKRRTVGEQNIREAEKTLRELGLTVSKADIGGTSGRKLFFSLKTGDVYLRKLRLARGGHEEYS